MTGSQLLQGEEVRRTAMMNCRVKTVSYGRRGLGKKELAAACGSIDSVREVQNRNACVTDAWQAITRLVQRPVFFCRPAIVRAERIRFRVRQRKRMRMAQNQSAPSRELQEEQRERDGFAEMTHGRKIQTGNMRCKTVVGYFEFIAFKTKLL